MVPGAKIAPIPEGAFNTVNAEERGYRVFGDSIKLTQRGQKCLSWLALVSWPGV